MPGGGRLTVSLERHGEMAEIELEDTGRGIAPENSQRVFPAIFYDEGREEAESDSPAPFELCNC